MPTVNITFRNFNQRKVDGYTDWRLPANRVEAITRISHFRYLSGDLDHTQAGLAAAELMQLDNEQKAWFSVLFGHSYRAQNAYILLEQFPDLAHTSPKYILNWMETPTGFTAKGKPRYNGNRMIYGKDSKWNRWKLHESIESIQQWLDGRPLYETLCGLVDSGTTKQNRQLLEEAVSSWKYFGWMSTWLTLQMLWDFFKWDIDNWTIPFKSNWSSYNGIMYIYDHRQLMSTKTYKPDKKDIALADMLLIKLMSYMTEQLPFKPDTFSIESVLCEYRKTVCGPRVKEYTGWTSSELACQYPTWKNWWDDDVDMFPILAGLMARSRIVRATDYDKRYFRVTYETGMLQNVSYVYPTEPDVYVQLGLAHPETMPLKELVDDWAANATKENREFLLRQLPAKRLKWKRKTEQINWVANQLSSNTGLGFL